MPRTYAFPLDAESEIRTKTDRLAGARRIRRAVACDRPLGRSAAVVEHGLTDELDLDVAFQALDRAHEHVLAVVVGRWARVRSDRVHTVRRTHRQSVTNDDPAGRRLPGRLEDVRAGLVHT